MNLTDEQCDLVEIALYEMARQTDQVAASCHKAAETDTMPIRREVWEQAADEAEEQAFRIRELADIIAEAYGLALLLDDPADQTVDETGETPSGGESETADPPAGSDDADHDRATESAEPDGAVSPDEALAEHVEEDERLNAIEKGDQI